MRAARAGYVAATGNSFGIALGPNGPPNAACRKPSRRLSTLSENRKAEEVVGKLTPGELKRVIEVVSFPQSYLVEDR
jgi:hypothetical protein